MSDTLTTLLSEKGKRKYTADELAFISQAFREDMFTILHERKTGHWGGSSSADEIMTSLYFNRLNIDPKNPGWEERDRFILSKGHASVALYTILANRGYFPKEDLHTFRTFGSYLQGHPCMNKIPGVDFSSGALGHGISVAIGMALASSLSGKNYTTYVMTGEGCLNEGQSWEALMFAAKEKVKNLVLLIDYNKVQLDGTEDEIMPLEPLKEKLESFGWLVNDKKYDGNNTKDVLSSFTFLDSTPNVPKCIIYDTIKGKGIDFSEGKNTWHGAVIDDEHYEIGIKQLRKDREEKEKRL